MTALITHQCEWSRHDDCTEPRHCYCLCHRPYDRPARPKRRVWGRWT